MEGVSAKAAGQYSSGSSVAPAEVSKGAFSSLKRKCFYVKKISKNFAELERNERYLCNEETDAKTRLDRNRVNMEKTSKCETWLTEVDKLKAEIENLRTNYHNTRKFLGGIYPFFDLLKLSKQIVEKTAETVSLINQIGQITIMVEKKEPDRVMKKPYVPSLKEHVEMLHECLRNEELKRICIWGPPGVGKTTIMEKLFDVVGASDEFDISFWVTVNKEGNEKDIQKALLRRLNISAEYCSDEQKADRISQVLKNKRYVLFIDEVFSKLDLESIGINDEHKRGKVVFTGRYRHICGQTDDDIYVERLSDEDAQNLFWEIVGRHLKNNQEINPVAETIIEECCGMPHLIKLLGNYLAEVNDPSIWRDTLVQLRSPLEQEEPKQEIQKRSPNMEQPKTTESNFRGELLTKDRQEELPTKDYQEELPIKDRREQLPTKDYQEKLPIKDRREQFLTKSHREELPTKDYEEELPIKDRREQLPTKDYQEKLPIKDRREQLLTKDRREEIATKDYQEKLPIKDHREQRLTKDRREQLPAKDCLPIKDHREQLPTKYCLPIKDQKQEIQEIAPIPTSSQK